MGILSSLTKLIPVVGPALGDILGGQQKGEAQGQISQAQLQQNQDRNALDLYGQQQQAQNQAGSLDLQRKGYDATSRSAAGKQALLAMLMGDYKPTSIDVPGIKSATISGGMGDTIKNNPQILELLKSIASKGVTDQATPNAFTGGNVIAAPKLTPLPQKSKTSGILDKIARIAQIAGGVGSLLPKKGGGGMPSGGGDWGGYG